MRRAALALTVLAATAALALTAGPSPAPGAPIPALAYYYIWFNASSWNRAKTDYPLLGRYSSDERSVMDRHVRWAQEAGIDGFIVSWKSTPVLDERLRKLIDVATERHFRLQIIYQGLDFHRRPLAPDVVLYDLRLFAHRYADAAPFRQGGPPTVIWSGSWAYSLEDVARTAAAVRPEVRLLASEKNVEDYRRVARYVDGDAYYWSSADPFRTPGFQRKLRDMGRAVHDAGGLWIAPAASGFDARLIGGRRIIPRRSGRTLEAALNAAEASNADEIGVISWNEYSENSHLEPSRRYGYEGLRTLSDMLGSRLQLDTSQELDSSSSSPTGTQHGVPLLLGFFAFIVGGGLTARHQRAAYRGRRSAHPTLSSPTKEHSR